MQDVQSELEGAEVVRSHLLDDNGVRKYIDANKTLSALIGGTPESWQLREAGDGNLNYVWVVQGATGAFVLKQAPPFIRLIPTLPLSTERASFEHLAMTTEYRFTPDHVPKAHHFDPEKSIIVMEYLTPHIILRKGLIEATVYPHLAEHVSDFLAKTLFFTSDLYLKSDQKRKAVAQFHRNGLVHLTEEYVFTQPWTTHRETNNYWVKDAALEAEIKSVQSDVALKVQVSHLKERFSNFSQALLHGDMHTGSIMVTPEKTSVIDAEFAFYGPMGFDVGAYLANLLLAYFSQEGHAQQDTSDKNRDAYKTWLLGQFEQTWNLFERKFIEQWNANFSGDAFSFLLSGEDKAAAQKSFLSEVLSDSLGFAGTKMMRRIIGVAKVEDFKAIKNETIRAQCELKALKVGRALVFRRATLQIADVLSLVKEQN